MCSALLRALRLLLILQLILCDSLCSSKRYRRYYQKRFNLTLSVRNHNVTEAKFFRLNGVGNTVDFFVAPGDVFTKTYEAKRKGFWTLFVEFPGNRYSKSPRKIISRDSHKHWIMEVYYYPGAVGFSDWHRVHGELNRNNIAD
uniref:rRNA N-glycosidase n=1 Tax=Setaria digitata TaxID=48799 RepID=A0A915PL64_9BILA